MNRVFGICVVFMGAAGYALAGSVAPEVDAGSAGAAIALISGGLLVLRSRRKKIQS